MPKTLVPVRLEPVPKRRLAHLADRRRREALVRRMLSHVLGVLGDVGLEAVVLARGPLTVDGVEVWQDRAPGLNRALDGALDRTGLPALIVHADLPRLAAEDIEHLLASPADVAIARARDGGTNALSLRRRIRPAFGLGSALRHAREARDAGLRAQVLDRPGLAFDLDDESGLTSYPSSPPPRP